MAQTMVRCREIRESDVDAVADLLTRGFGRSRAYWMQGLQRQALRNMPEGYPRFGYMLDHDGAPVGVLLLLYTARKEGGETAIQCNLSSWYVEPDFRNYATMLTKVAQRHKDVTYLNISPATKTWPIIETQGFRSYCSGLFFSFPLLAPARPDVAVEIVSADATGIDDISAAEVELLTRHARYGCLSLVCRTADGAFPFILQPMRIRRGWIAPPVMQLIYCRDIADYVACASAIGRVVLRHGKISVSLDSNGPIAGLAGIYTEARGRKYFKGPKPPRLADLTDTELVLYGP
ncbi:acyl-CoA acyltransferase [Bradyrhizobium guangdongense]|uniref:acyl-CoA acyltransferase n=1 Tax=Bradyrhizobium guangdongense TaxID=1325090 RepID=UPI00112A42EB|nr:acyl-CoA acyltransferase [Bradyrhizobium guangdongense]TPQ42574.1 acyl-CoA acyltransferase [Bradyrhizobium guangdongense]